MPSVFATITDEVVNAVDLASFSRPLVVEKDYLTDIKLENVSGNKLHVRPSSINPVEIRANAGRVVRSYDVPLDLTLVSATAYDDDGDLEDAMLLAEEIDRFLFTELRVTPSGAQWVLSTMGSPFSDEDYRERGVVIINMTAVYRAHK